ncbi:MAG: hypothetical protein A3E57_06450 [Candidatus Muproteobacteria bacterium RIFCSPHIGHO2_12_FULL_60_33]|uniref:Uncharacterized protein n=1 Tax=Candidatus Muproteobacteria bacterium RIFCSPLOWO2_01_FULL_60_18 TaxID=1817768 RepID=A0A1F6TXH2_9PROT|nr:MAG: hypothetical protein A2W42_04215 [Candidatus Muproteobacteria bacterium RIFCSPHIGHO2_01_60_12]OGI49769.1 MAG: hypothetical protein A3A87_10205 [Candidatus Muproteobacteria bacterium RIFCSPLOWO2_01_FULL_60_18]OGI53347.1 MAG: hypothetical protein A3E57_06450 [Candidatus Muproteobacteria bacterium RIFCSPHIGHO2_12_FULL_60_33]OGI55478.1 MAG: hypothetical protein A3D32_02850 [Candidatus Muproteobacteria bacterium RIFCSPHIGHO2_02_FULL_60_13]OGI59838.1 MAG: hypothetical protein A2809_00580 [Can
MDKYLTFRNFTFLLLALYGTVCLYETGGLLVAVNSGKEKWADVPTYLGIIFLANGFVAFMIYGLALLIRRYATGSLEGALFRNAGPSTERLVCPQCGTIGRGVGVTRGSTAIEVTLWLFMILPGFIYSLWRRAGQSSNNCSKCGGKMIGIDTPRGRELAGKYKSS